MISRHFKHFTAVLITWWAGFPLVLSMSACSLGPRTIEQSRLRYNEAVKVTSEQQLLLNVVRLRYIDSPSSLSLASIADQQELIGGLSAIPFFTSAGAGDFGGYRGTVLPQATLSRATRPTLSYVPLDDQEFTQRLFTPVSLDGVAYLSKTTWPISTVFRLYLENLNWVSNAETASGPTPKKPPEYAEYLQGIASLQRLQDLKLITLYAVERDETIAGPLISGNESAALVIDALKSGLDVSVTPQGTSIVKRKKQPVMRIDDAALNEPDWFTFCSAFHLDPSQRTLDLTAEKLDPYLQGTPSQGLSILDLETRSLLQVLFFVSHGVQVPREHLVSGAAPQTCEANGQPFEWQQVLGGLFRVCSVKAKRPPANAQVAVEYRGYWFYIDQSDSETKATFALLLEVSRLELESTGNKAPLLTLPLGR